jgi:hypothetical protein
LLLQARADLSPPREPNGARQKSEIRESSAHELRELGDDAQREFAHRFA